MRRVLRADQIPNATAAEKPRTKPVNMSDAAYISDVHVTLLYPTLDLANEVCQFEHVVILLIIVNAFEPAIQPLAGRSVNFLVCLLAVSDFCWWIT